MFLAGLSCYRTSIQDRNYYCGSRGLTWPNLIRPKEYPMSNVPPPAVLVTLKEAAKLLAISERTLWQLQADGRLPSVRIGRCLRFRVSDIEAFAQSL